MAGLPSPGGPLVEMTGVHNSDLEAGDHRRDAFYKYHLGF